MLTDQGDELEYWRVEKAHSVIVLPIYQQQFLLPPAQYRPGIGEWTLDFPGGRLPQESEPEMIVPEILKRELGVEKSAIASIIALNPQGWPINSSFSNQRLFGFVAKLDASIKVDFDNIGYIYEISASNLELLKSLQCLQCRMVLLEWMHDTRSSFPA